MRPLSRAIAIGLIGLAASIGSPVARAQIRLPGGLPQLPTTPQLPLPPVQQPLQRTLDSALAPADLAGLRERTIGELLRRHGRELQRDPRGEPVIRGELLALPSDATARAAVLAEGYAVLREEALDGLDLAWLVLRPPPGLSLDRALALLRRLDPAGQYDHHHVYLRSGTAAAASVPSAAEPGAASGSAGAGGGAGRSAGPNGGSAGAPAASSGSAGAPPDIRVGLVDAGVDVGHPALQGTDVRRHGCAAGAGALPSAHGTAVASLLVGRAGDFRGAAPGARLYAADVYCGAPAGGSVQAIAQALAWLARERVAVINISLVGPPNALLERAVAALVARGHLLVAAVGNDGPAAPPLYPAAWPGVVGVTATDVRRRVLPEAARGAHVALAAPGADLAAASREASTRFEAVRGTSFAAPLVAGLLAPLHRLPDRDAAAAALAALTSAAVDLGAPGRDPVFGAGLVGEALRVEPQRLAASSRR